jgi:hypothetical protein
MTIDQVKQVRELIESDLLLTLPDSSISSTEKFDPTRTGIAVQIRAILKSEERFEYASSLISSYYNCRNFACAIAISSTFFILFKSPIPSLVNPAMEVILLLFAMFTARSYLKKDPFQIMVYTLLVLSFISLILLFLAIQKSASHFKTEYTAQEWSNFVLILTVLFAIFCCSVYSSREAARSYARELYCEYLSLQHQSNESTSGNAGT